MEFNPSSIKKSGQKLCKSDDHDQASGHAAGSYTCTFCKREFSNPQALGGHMNTHRRVRAKLKESSGDLSKKIFPDHDKFFADSSEERGCNPERPWIFSEEDDGCRGKGRVGELEKVNLVEGTQPSRKIYVEGRSENQEKSKKLSHGSPHAELDLELRLGLEPGL
ncbi:hypothetical protein U1Q18_013412 [Sarracenia purpurea var. burkii]